MTQADWLKGRDSGHEMEFPRWREVAPVGHKRTPGPYKGVPLAEAARA